MAITTFSPNPPRAGTGELIIDAINANADEMFISISIPQNGTLRWEKYSGAVIDVSIPYFSDDIISGFSPITLSGTLNANVPAGTGQIDGQLVVVSGSTVLTITPNPSGNDRIDAIVLNANGTVTLVDGTPALTPVAPTLLSTQLPLAYLFVLAGTVDISTVSIADLGAFSKIPNGNTNGQVPIWNAALGRYIPGNITGSLPAGTVTNSILKYSGTAWIEEPSVLVGANSVGGLDVNARFIEINDRIIPPVPTTDRLYNNSGNLFWNGVRLNNLILPSGSGVGDTIYWNGANWLTSGPTLRNFGNAGGVSKIFAFSSYSGNHLDSANRVESTLLNIFNQNRSRFILDNSNAGYNLASITSENVLTGNYINYSQDTQINEVNSWLSTSGTGSTVGADTILFKQVGGPSPSIQIRATSATNSWLQGMNFDENGVNLFNSGICLNVTTYTSNANIDRRDNVVVANPTSSPLTLTLPVAPTDGRHLVIKTGPLCTAINTVTVGLNGKNLNGTSTAPVYTSSYQTLNIVFSSNLDEWITIA